VRDMNRRGILADVSHVSDAAVFQVLEVALLPPFASHSSARALCEVPRNLPDELVREIARRRGLVMANSYAAFLAPEAAAARTERHRRIGAELEATAADYLRDPQRWWKPRADLVAAHPLPAVPLSVYVDHVIHLIELGGEEHVGIGTDFDGIPETLVGFDDASCFPSLASALRARGLDERGVELVMGENFLRLLALADSSARG
jgi:membrane dipeptidase